MSRTAFGDSQSVLPVAEDVAQVQEAGTCIGVDRPMTYKSILFVDYENVGKVDLNAIPADVLVPFFFGASQKSVPTEFMKAASSWASVSFQ